MFKKSAIKNSKDFLINHIRERLVSNVNCGDILYDLGKAYVSKGDFNQATRFLCQAIATDKGKALYYTELGHALYESSNSLEAVCAFRQALALDDGNSEAYRGLGIALAHMEEPELAAASLQSAIQRSPRIAVYWLEISGIWISVHKYVAAYKAAKQAYILDVGKKLDCYTYLSESLFGQHNFKGGYKWLLEGLRRHLKETSAWYSVGRALENANKFSEARKYFTKAIQLKQDNADAHLGLAGCLLAAGNYTDGWNEYEWRLKVKRVQNSPTLGFMKDCAEPMWNGEDINGKVLLVYSEQGFGDSILMVRYVAELKKRNCKIILMVYPALVLLLRDLVCKCTLISYADLIPRFDYHIPLFSVPRVLKTTIRSTPDSVPYIRVVKRGRTLKSICQSANIRVGFFWTTKPLTALDYRSINLDILEPLFKIKSINYFSLQLVDPANDLSKIRYANVYNLAPYIKDWKDTAALMSKMDLIISIDSAIAHLAGSMAIPIWVLLPHSADWRWLSTEESIKWRYKSPWYPTMRLFRSPSRNSWKIVIERMRKELLKYALNYRRPANE
jgi:tetratricopeptide (TPR) repeat protein